MKTLKIIFCGDFAPVYRNEELILNNSKKIFSSINPEIMAADISFVNLECPLTLYSKKDLKRGPNLRAHPKCIIPLKEIGFNAIGLANNHIKDYGTQGVLDTIQLCEKHCIKACGAGKNIKEAQKPLYITKKGITLAIIAIAEQEFCIASENNAGAAPLDPIVNYYQILEAKKHADLVFITIHGGNEYFPFPRPGLRKICHFFIDLGVDAIICHHPHVPGPFEFYKNKPIVYSLGNFLFDHKSPSHPDWEKGFMVSMDYNPTSLTLEKFSIIPYSQSYHHPGIKRLEGKEKQQFLTRITKMEEKLGNNFEYSKEWQNFCQHQANRYLGYESLPFTPKINGKLGELCNIFNFSGFKTKYLLQQNLIECESHRELLLQILKKKIKKYER